MTKVQFNRGPKEAIKSLFKCCLIFLFNGPLSKYYSKDYAILNDGAHSFGLKTYYVKPLIQIEQLKACDFNLIQLFSINDGEEISPSEYASLEDSWVYYFCRVAK